MKYHFSNTVSSILIKTWKESLQMEGLCALELESGEPGPDASVLVVTDERETLLACAQSCPVVVFLHEQNEKEDFSGAAFAIMELEGTGRDYLQKVYERFFHIPWTIMETERCVLREMTVEDLPQLYQVYADPSISLFTENLYEDPEKERAYIEDYIKHVYEFYGFGIWVIVQKADNQVIGRAGITYREGFDTPELGYVVGKPFQRKGIATEVCRKILNYAWNELGFEQVRVLFEKENTASLGLCRKLGMRFDRVVFLDEQPMEQYIAENQREQ